MEVVPPEVLTIILEFLTLDSNRNNVLGYRRVNSQWKDIIDSLVEKKIISAQFPICPGMRIVDLGGVNNFHVHVRYSETRLSPDSSHFPFNSLLINGSSNARDFNYDLQFHQIPVTLLDFASQFFGSLTSFALHNQVFPIPTVITVLGSMPSLKMLSLMNVQQVNSLLTPDAVLPTPPPLPKLVTLEVASAPVAYGKADEKRNMLYLWLVASYADQLIRLVVDTGDVFPPLRRSHQYSIQSQFVIASTSESAFGNLKELRISRPTAHFLEFSDTPALHHFSVTRVARGRCVYLQDLAKFIEKCGSTLETLHLDRRWGHMIRRVNIRALYNGGKQLSPLAEGVASKLKTLTLSYPNTVAYETILSREFIRLFPALELLQLLYYEPSFNDYEWNLANDGDKQQNVDKVDEIIGLKARLAFLWQRMFEMNDNLWNLRTTDVDAAPQRKDIAAVAEINELNLAVVATRKERDVTFNRLAALGEKREKVVVEQLMERGGYWSNCPNLKTVSVSVGGKPVGDVCLLRRVDHA